MRAKSLDRECLEYSLRLAEIVRRASEGCECALLSGGIDTTFTLASLGWRAAGVRAFTVDLGGEDLRYARSASEKLGLSLVILKPGARALLNAVKWVVMELATIDPVEVAADTVHYISLTAARSWGCSCVLSGDGGDELFIGYQFLLERGEREVEEWLREMASGGAWLPTVYIGERLGLRVLAPLYTWEARRLALETPLECLKGPGVGKWILRLYLDLAGLREIAWREKTPVTEGSGSLKMLAELLGNVSPDPGRVESVLGFKPPSRLHRALATLLLDHPEAIPPKGPPDPCPVCGRPTRRGFCRFCGAYFRGGRISIHMA